MATETLRAMALGGMRDHIGGGFHRYSVDGDWRVPHFEKMLVRPGAARPRVPRGRAGDGRPVLRRRRGGHAVVRASRHDRLRGRRSTRQRTPTAFRPSRRTRPARTSPKARSTSGPTRRSRVCLGRTPRSLADVSGSNRQATHRRTRRESSPARTCSTRTNRSRTIAIRSDKSADEIVTALGRIRERLFAARETRPRPHLDDKILTAWNGLMIAAFARAAACAGDRPTSATYLESATRAASFIRRTLWSVERAAAPVSRRRGSDSRRTPRTTPT